MTLGDAVPPAQLSAGVIPSTQLGHGLLLQWAADAAAEQAHAPGSGPLHFARAAEQFTAVDQLPSQVTEITSSLVHGPTTGASNTRVPLCLGFHNSRAQKGQKFLRRQPNSRQLFMRGDMGAAPVTVGLSYNPPGKQDQIHLLEGGRLGLVSCSSTCTVNTKSATEAGGSVQTFSKVRVIIHLVLRKVPASNSYTAPYWREWEPGVWEVGCVALYEFPGDLLPPLPTELLYAAPAVPLVGAEQALAADACIGGVAVLQQLTTAAGQVGLPLLAGSATASIAGAATSASAAAAAAAAAASMAAPPAAELAAAVAAASGPPVVLPTDNMDLISLYREFAEDRSDDGDTASLPDLGAPAEPRLAASLQLLEDQGAELQHRLLKVAAGMYGDRSMAVLADLLPVYRHYCHNAQRHAVGRPPLSVADMAESWFLHRSPLHLLVSKVRVWGPGGDESPPELSDNTRMELLQALCGAPQDLKKLLKRGNRNKATPWFTAAHFCNPAALDWLISRQELTFQSMLARTKRGKLFYHIISTQAHNASSDEDRQRLQQGMVKVLTALPGRIQNWLDTLGPGQEQRQRNILMSHQQQRQQRHHSRLQATAAAAPAAATTAPARVRALSDLTCDQPGLGAVLQPAGSAAQGLLGAAAPPAAAVGPQQHQPGTAAAHLGALIVPLAQSWQQQLQGQDVQHPQAGIGGDLVPMTGNGGSSSRGDLSRLQLSEPVLWWLQNYVIFHTKWYSSRSASPPYNGELLEELALALYGFSPRHSFQ